MKNTLEVKLVRGGAMNDEQLMQCMAVAPEQPLFRGVMEILDRFEDAADDEFCNMQAMDHSIIRGGTIKATVRELRKSLSSWRERGVERASGGN